jgi:hypothetical protein
MKRILSFLMVYWLASGCLAATAGVAAWQLSKNRTQNQYREYEASMEKTNQERQDNGPRKLRREKNNLVYN